MILNSQGTPYLRPVPTSFLNPAHPAASRVSAGFLDFRNPVVQKPSTYNATITDIGAGNYFNGTTSKTLFPKGVFATKGPLTIMAVVTPTSLSAKGIISAFWSTGSWSPSMTMYYLSAETDGSCKFYRAKTNNTMNKFTTDTGVLAVGKKTVIVVTHEGASTDANARWAANGKLKEGVGAWDGNYGGGNTQYANNSIGCEYTDGFGGGGEAYGDFFTGYIESIVFWEWYMPGNLMRQLSVNPYELFIPRVGRVFKGSSSASVTVNPTVLSLAANLQAPAISGDANITHVVQSLVAGLQAPAVSGGATVSPTVQSLVANLQAPVVSTDGNVTVSPSALSCGVNLQTPAVSGNAEVSPAVLSLVLSALAPSIAGNANFSATAFSIIANLISSVVGGDANVSPAVLTLTENLLTATITGTANVTPAALSLILGLQAPTVTIGQIDAPAIDLKSKQERTVNMTSQQSRTDDLKSKQSRSITGESAF